MADTKNQKRDTYTIYDDEGIGTVQIADEVVAIIAGLAATEVEGVASMAGNITNELGGKLGMKNLSKGVKVDVLDGVVCVDLALNIKYGYGIPETSQTVQEKVKAAIEAAAEALGDDGRILVRESGTEPLIRVMVEAGTDDLCHKYVDSVVDVMEAEGLVVE